MVAGRVEQSLLHLNLLNMMHTTIIHHNHISWVTSIIGVHVWNKCSLHKVTEIISIHSLCCYFQPYNFSKAHSCYSGYSFSPN